MPKKVRPQLAQIGTELDEFCRQTGMEKQYNRSRVLGFGRSEAQKGVQGGKKLLTNANGDVILKVDDVRITFAPNSITQRKNAKGGIDRNYYGSDGKQFKQISDNDHGHKEESMLGEHGEHAHDYHLDENGIPKHGKARELTPQERKENSDIL